MIVPVASTPFRKPATTRRPHRPNRNSPIKIPDIKIPMPHTDLDRLRGIKTLASLVAYLRDELDWPIESDDIEDISFDYTSAELGIAAEAAVRIKEIKQLRPLNGNQPWGIFWVNFEKKRLPVVVMRLILRALVLKKRASSGQAERQAWAANDLLFISAYGEETDRAVSFAHFVENPGNNLAELRVLGWDDDDTPLHMDYVAQMLHAKLRWDDKLAAKPDAWRKQWSDAFLIRHRHVVRTSEELATTLAALARRIRSRIRTVLRSEDGFGEMRKLQRAFQVGLIHDLNDEGFADMFAQTVTYGLFSLACRRTIPGEGTAFAKDDLPHYFTSPFLKEMLGVFLGIKSRKGAIDFDELGVSDVTDLLTSPDTHMEVVLADFNNKTRGEDPVIHFYEHFLSAYNKQLKIQRGVFYTPQPVVSYIVRSVHELLQTEFGLADGLADTTTWGEMLKKHPGLKLPPLTDEPGEKRTISPDEMFVQILDPATGTATFLVEVIDVVFNHLKARWAKGGLAAMPVLPGVKTGHCKHFTEYWNLYVPAALLPRLHAFELMMAPYAIAHMKIGLKLAETGYRFGTEERARIYLTNALEPAQDFSDRLAFDAPALAHEAQAVNAIKRQKRFTVIIGNPPYSGVSSNMNPWIDGLLKGAVSGPSYYDINGEPLAEKKVWLQDDYAKFIRLSHWLIDASGEGIVGLITNHGYLDNPTFRGMREKLIRRYHKIAVCDLHGNVRKKEKARDGSPDENVFDIEQGVAIGIFVANSKHKQACSVVHSELFGLRADKYRLLQGDALSTNELALTSPYYFFVPHDESKRSEYDTLFSVTSIFREWITGVQTSRDAFAIGESTHALGNRISEFLDTKIPDDHFRSEYGLKDMSFWNISEKRKEFRKCDNPSSHIKPIAYRPFDTRFVIYHETIIHRPKMQVMINMIRGKNVALLLPRQLSLKKYRHAFCTRGLAEMCVISTNGKEQNNLFPLFLHHSKRGPQQSLLPESSQHETNFSPTFLSELCRSLSLKPGAAGVPSGLTPEVIFNYLYALLHSPAYCERYESFLRIDFPRLPLTGNLELFRALARLGGELTALHLLEAPKLAQPITEFIGGRHPEVEKISWSGNTVWVDKAQTTGFRGVREEVWNFHIGGYQVCEKWLKDRKGRPLTKDDLAHYQKIVIALSETIRLMGEIDAVIEKAGGWPLK